MKLATSARGNQSCGPVSCNFKTKKSIIHFIFILFHFACLSFASINPFIFFFFTMIGLSGCQAYLCSEPRAASPRCEGVDDDARHAEGLAWRRRALAGGGWRWGWWWWWWRLVGWLGRGDNKAGHKRRPFFCVSLSLWSPL